MTKTRIKLIDGKIYLGQPEVAERRQVHTATVDYWRKNLGLPGRRIGGRWYYAETELDQWEKSRGGEDQQEAGAEKGQE